MMALKRVIGEALPFLARYRDRRLDDLSMAHAAHTSEAQKIATRAQKDVDELQAIIELLRQTQ